MPEGHERQPALTSRRTWTIVRNVVRMSSVEVTQAAPVDVASASAPPRRWPRLGVVASTLAVLTAPLVWIAVAIGVVRGDVAYPLPGGIGGFVAMVALSSTLDIGAAWLIITDRRRGLLLGYLALRSLLAAIGIIFVALPS